MENNKLNRRNFLKKAALYGAAVPAAGVILAACKSGGSSAEGCTDVSSLAPADKQMRETLKYVDVATNPAQDCAGCQFFTAPASGQTCGSCTLVKGPINSKGGCLSWAKKVA